MHMVSQGAARSKNSDQQGLDPLIRLKLLAFHIHDRLLVNVPSPVALYKSGRCSLNLVPHPFSVSCGHYVKPLVELELEIEPRLERPPILFNQQS
jgi:hypothetical protein